MESAGVNGIGHTEVPDTPERVVAAEIRECARSILDGIG